MTDFPDVPPLPGVPPLARDPSQSFPQPTLSTSDSVSDDAQTQSQQWGIFDQDGNAVLTGDSTLSFEFKHEFTVSDYPIEQGGFVSYNKVAIPFDGRFTMTKGGSLADRTDFLNLLETLVADTNLYNAVTPERTYLNVNIDHYDYRRTDRAGVTLLTVNVWCVEIRTSASAAYSNTQSPSGADPVNSGAVLPQPPATELPAPN